MKQKLTETETGSRNYSKYERHLSEVCNTCHRYDLVITPGLETLQTDAVQQKMSEIAKFLKLDFKDAMKIQRTPWVEADKVKMEDLYTRLRIEKHTKKPQRTMKEELVNYCELFKNLNENKRILIKGNPGIGKTTFSRKMVFDWASDMWNEPELNSIVLLFLVTLKYINNSQKPEDMVKQQHSCLTLNDNIPSGLLKEIMEKCGEQCLVILEGYDEIPEGCKAVLDPIMKKQTYRDCHFLITSRPNAVEYLEYYMSSIASIEGFSKENTKNYIEKVIEDPTKWQAAFKYTENSAIEDMWRYPILVLFLCLLVNWGAVDLDKENLMVGEFYKRLLDCIYRRFIVEKIEKEKQEEEEAKKEETLLKIGKIAFKGLLSNKVTYRKGEILKAAGPNAFQFGILIGTDEWEGRRDIPENADIFVYFVHKSIQEYLAAKYLMHQLQKGKSIEKLMSGKNATTKFIQDNLMFFTFCGYFTNIDNTPDSDSDTESDEDEDTSINDAALGNVTAEQIREQLVDFIAKCLDEQELKLEGVAIYEESSWLFLEALPKCSNIKELVLKDMNLKVSLLFLLQGISQSLEYLHVDSCVFDRTTEDDITITFPKMKTIALSGKRGGAYLLKSSAWSGVETLNLQEYKLNRDDLKIIDEANKHGYLQSVKEIAVSEDTHLSSHVRELLNNEWPLLKTLDMYECNLTGDDISAIHEAHKKGYLPSIDLTVKSLTSGHISGDEDDLSDGSGSYDESLQSWHIPVVPVMCGAWKEQEVLDLCDCEFSNQDVITIAGANRYGLLPCVKEINLMGNTNIAGQVSTLLSSPWNFLSKLIIEHHKLVKEDISAIGEATNKGFLPSIDLTEKSLSSSGHIPIVPIMCGAWREQEVLDLSNCTFSKQDVITIAEANRCGLMPSVKAIKDLGEVANTRYFSTLFSQPWSSLEILDINKFSEQDVKTVAQANKNGILPSINEIIGLERVSGTEQFNTIFSHPWKSLKTLDINKFSEQDVKTITEANKYGALPSINEITGLERVSMVSGTKQFSTIFSHPWNSLEILDIRKCCNEDMITITEANRHGMLPSVKDIKGLDRIAGTKQFSSLFSNPWKSLETLDLKNCNEQNMMTIAVANRNGFLPSVKDIKCLEEIADTKQFSSLFSNPWKSLETLDLKNCSEQNMMTIAVANRNGLLPSVSQIISLERVVYAEQLGTLFLHQWKWISLEILDMTSCDKQDVMTIAEANRRNLLPSVKKINLMNNCNVSGHVSTLLSNKWPVLKSLNMEECNITTDDISAIHEAHKKGFLPSIDLTVTSLPLSGHIPVVPIICGAWRKADRLYLRKCELSDQDVITLAEANRCGLLPSVEDVNLSLKKNASGHVNAILSCKWPLLKTLNMDKCYLTRDDISAISIAHEKKHLPSLQEINLGGNENVSGHVNALLTHEWPLLKTLKMAECNLTQDDISVISIANEKRFLFCLEEISLRGNGNISGHVNTLLSNKWPSLKSLDMEECNLIRDDISAIHEAHEKGFLPSIDLTVKSLLGGYIPLVAVMCGAWREQKVLDLGKCDKQDVITIAEANRHGLLPSVNNIYGIEVIINTGHFRALFSHMWQSLKTLDMSRCHEQAMITTAEANRCCLLPSVQEINLRSNKNISGLVNALLRNEWPVLEKLDMIECNLITDDVTAIHEAHKKGFLPSIDLTVKSLLSGHIPIVPVMCGAWREQEVLDLSRGNEQDVITIAEANRHGLLPSVKEINLPENMNASGHINSLLSIKWQSLQKLHLQDCNLTVEDIRALGEANRKGYLPSLKEVDLAQNKALSGQLASLFTHTWPVLQKLNLQGNYMYVSILTVEDIRALGEANRKGYLPSLQILHLSRNRALSGQLTLLFTHTWPFLQELILECCRLTGEDIRALVEANRKGYLPSVQILALSDNEALSGQLTLLFTHIWPVLQELRLYWCKLTPADGDTLLDACRQGRLPQLRELDIRSNKSIPDDKKRKLKEHIEEVKAHW